LRDRSFRERSRARAWALQILYAWESRQGDASPLAVYEEFLTERNVASSSRLYIRRILDAIVNHAAEIDRELENALTNWRLNRLAAIDRNILRIAAAEMLFVGEVPPRVSIQEAIALAEKFGTTESPRFVNGVLDALMRRIEGRERRRPSPEV